MTTSTGRHSSRLGIGDLVAGLRILLLPLAVVAVLLAVGRLFRQDPAAADAMPGVLLSGVPREAWAWALLAYLAVIAPRRPLRPRLPGLSLGAKGLIVALAGTGFWLELRHHQALAPLLQAGLAASCVVAAAAVARAVRMRRDQARKARDQGLEQMILELERRNLQPDFDPAITHPALFAELGSVLNAGSTAATSIWFLRPHPALGHKRPIDVLREPGGEAQLLRASRLGPNS